MVYLKVSLKAISKRFSKDLQTIRTYAIRKNQGRLTGYARLSDKIQKKQQKFHITMKVKHESDQNTKYQNEWRTVRWTKSMI